MASILRVDHIAVAVPSIAEARKQFEGLYGAVYLGQNEIVESQYIVAYFQVGEDIFTLLEGTTPESFVTQHVEKRGQGIQHMGVEVDDLDAFLAQLEDGGARVSNYIVREGVRKEALISPRSAFGIILQPIEWLGEMKTMPHAERIVAAGRMDAG
ncbi:MAG: methylmalonyl-CoA epimerase [Chloroflexi bacterium]|nr:MAG: methylmalonyl-CoA epimerase [Chloroflexota bacterium]